MPLASARQHPENQKENQAGIRRSARRRAAETKKRDSGVSIFRSIMAALVAASYTRPQRHSGSLYNKTLSRPRLLRCRKGAPGLHRRDGNGAKWILVGYVKSGVQKTRSGQDKPPSRVCSGRWCRHRETDDTRGHKGTPHTIQQTNHCTPLSSALGQRLQARHAVALQCGVGLLVSTSRIGPPAQ